MAIEEGGTTPPYRLSRSMGGFQDDDCISRCHSLPDYRHGRRRLFQGAVGFGAQLTLRAKRALSQRPL